MSEGSIHAPTEGESANESSHDEIEEAARSRREFSDAILHSVDNYMESKNSAFEKRIERLVEKSTDATVKKAAKKIKTDTPEISRPGCKDQYKHNLTVLEHIESAEKHIREAELKEALESLDAGKKEILKRQKLVLLADREENGWGFVREYVRDELASGTDDEKHMSKARATASKKKKARDTLRFKPYKTRPYSSSTSTRHAGYSGNYPKTSYSDRNNNNNFRSNDFRNSKYDRQCYGCGRRGHLVYACPKARKY